MSHLHIKLDYIVAKTVINGLKDWLKKLENMLDEGAKTAEITEKKDAGAWP